MASRKPSAKAKKLSEFRSQLGGMDDVFAQEQRRLEDLADNKEAALRYKACESKNRYASRSEAEEMIRTLSAYGKKGLRCYRCQYCNGWHLTSKPVFGAQR